MNQLIVIYEQKEKDSNSLNDFILRIKGYKYYAFPTKNSCIIWTENSVVSVRDHLNTFLKSGDKLFVSKVSAPAAWLNSVSQDTTDYIKSNLKE